MTPQILAWARETKERIGQPTGRLLEVGSRDINGSPRSVFTDARNYIGVDIEAGPGVDAVMHGDDLGFPDHFFDTVVCMECLEHCVRPWMVVAEMRRVLRSGGLLWVSAPTYGFELHRHPVDCYRFGEDAFRLWLYEGMGVLSLETLFDDRGQPCIAAVGRSE